MIRILYLVIFLWSGTLYAQQERAMGVTHLKVDKALSSNWILRNDRFAFRQTFAPFITLYRTPSRSDSYWQGLAFTRTSPDKFFASTYYYDMQGNLRETCSYFNIKRRGQLTNWKIQIPTRYRSPVLVHTF